MATLTKKQILNIRSGQTVYGVWGNTSTDLYVWRKQLTGKRFALKKGFGVGELYRSFSGTKAANYYGDYLATGLQGSFNDRFFTKKKQAEKFMIELKEGLHKCTLNAFDARNHEIDLIDESFLGVDRGLGNMLQDFSDDHYYPEDYWADGPLGEKVFN